MTETTEQHEHEELTEEEEEETSEGPKSVTGPLGLQMPCDSVVLREAHKLIVDKNSRVEALATTVLQDPIVVIEMLKSANALYFAGGSSAITSPKTAIVRLGSDVVAELFAKMNERPTIQDEKVSHWFELNRSRSKRIGIVARLFAEALARNFSEDSQAAGCLWAVGDMLATLHLKEDYVALAEEHARSGVHYRLAQNHRFDVERMGITYLRRSGVPESLLFAIDREGRSRTPDRAIIKPICMAASELVDAFDANKWEKLAPGKNLPPKSALRMLQMSDSQYLKIYERASEYLFSARMLDEQRRASQETEEEELDFSAPIAEPEEENALQSEIQDILSGSSEAEEWDEYEDDWDDQDESPEEPTQETSITQITESLGELESQFNLASAKSNPKTVARVSEPIEAVPPPQLRTKGGNKVVDSLSNLMDEADSSEELLADLLQGLTDGPFEKAALIVVSHDRKHAIVVAARGPIGNGQKIELNDPLSPLARCFSKVQSFATRPNEASPFGCKSFALAPIDADHETPVALYADCGENGAITFEARRVFRVVVDLLNQKLPSIPGGIPVEVGESP